jgi:hypothetical protein
MQGDCSAGGWNLDAALFTGMEKCHAGAKEGAEKIPASRKKRTSAAKQRTFGRAEAVPKQNELFSSL